MLYSKMWIMLFVLSLIIPVSLLESFRLTGLLHGPHSISETVVLEVETWEGERPTGSANINETVANHYGNEIELLSAVTVIEFEPGESLGVDVNTTAILQTGFMDNVNVTFTEDYESSIVNLPCLFWQFEFEHHQHRNVTIAESAFPRESKGVKAFATFRSTNRSRSVHIDELADWGLGSPYNKTHLLRISFEATYYNGSVFKKVVQPFTLRLGPDNNDSFQTATEVHEGNYTKRWLGFADAADYYKVYLNAGKTIKVGINGTHVDEYDVIPKFNVSIFNPQERCVIQTGYDYSQKLEIMPDSTGYWYIVIGAERHEFGFYSMEING